MSDTIEQPKKTEDNETTLDDAIEALLQVKTELDQLKVAFGRHEHKADGSIVFRGG